MWRYVIGQMGTDLSMGHVVFILGVRRTSWHFVFKATRPVLGLRGYFRVGKAAEAWRWPLVLSRAEVKSDWNSTCPCTCTSGTGTTSPVTVEFEGVNICANGPYPERLHYSLLPRSPSLEFTVPYHFFSHLHDFSEVNSSVEFSDCNIWRSSLPMQGMYPGYLSLRLMTVTTSVCWRIQVI